VEVVNLYDDEDQEQRGCQQTEKQAPCVKVLQTDISQPGNTQESYCLKTLFSKYNTHKE